MPPHGGMSEQKANQKDRVRIEVSQLRKYFPRNYTAHQMEQSILRAMLPVQRSMDNFILAATQAQVEGVVYPNACVYACDDLKLDGVVSSRQILPDVGTD